ncbi:hypothetical protein HY358_02535, partial [Candidatus Roizmanbacteria bacterium]|nr:hypothetical protein [Candidatus Roizmanbacteria bacterium]
MEMTPVAENKERFSPKSIVLFTPTYYQNWHPGERVMSNIDLVRGDVSLNTFRLVLEAGYQVVVVDRGSSQEYLDELRKIGITPFQQVGKSIAAAKREALLLAQQLQGAKSLVLIQPEKDSVIRSIPAIVRPILVDDADIVVAERNVELFRNTSPSLQFTSEMWASKWCNKIAHIVGLLPYEENRDWFFGVKALKNDLEIVELFMRKYQILDKNLQEIKQVDPERYSDFDYYPTVEAL